MVLKSKVSIAKTGTTSLRTTIPEGIVVYLDLEASDVLEWSMETMGNVRIAVAKKKK